jgi:hypothetical protein
MRWLLGALGAVVALAALVVVVGLVVPDEGIASGRAVFRQSPEVLWERIADFERWPEWNSTVDRVERGSDRDGKPVWNVQGARGAIVIEVFQPPRLLVARIPADEGVGFSGSRTYEIRPEGDGAASVTITERARVPNPVLRFFTIFQDDRAALESFLRELGTSFSEEVVPAALEATG